MRPVLLRYKPSLIVASSEILTEVLDLIIKTPSAESEAFVEFIAENQEPMSRSIRLYYIPVTAFSWTDLFLDRISLE